jgi:hypothetical protein
MVHTKLIINRMYCSILVSVSILSKFMQIFDKTDAKNEKITIVKGKYLI